MRAARNKLTQISKYGFSYKEENCRDADGGTTPTNQPMKTEQRSTPTVPTGCHVNNNKEVETETAVKRSHLTQFHHPKTTLIVEHPIEVPTTAD